MHTEESQWGWEVGEQELLNLEGTLQIGQDSGIKLSSGHGMENLMTRRSWKDKWRRLKSK